MSQFSPEFIRYLSEVEFLTEDQYRVKTREERLTIYNSFRNIPQQPQQPAPATGISFSGTSSGDLKAITEAMEAALQKTSVELLSNIEALMRLKSSKSTPLRSGTDTPVPAPALPAPSGITFPQQEVPYRSWEHDLNYSPNHGADYYYRALESKFNDGRNNKANFSIHQSGNPPVCLIKGGKKAFKILKSDQNYRNLYLEFYSCDFFCIDWIEKIENGSFNSMDYKSQTTPDG